MNQSLTFIKRKKRARYNTGRVSCNVLSKLTSSCLELRSSSFTFGRTRVSSVLRSLHHDLFTVLDIETWLGGSTQHRLAIERIPHSVGIIGRRNSSINSSSYVGHCANHSVEPCCPRSCVVIVERSFWNMKLSIARLVAGKGSIVVGHFAVRVEQHHMRIAYIHIGKFVTISEAIVTKESHACGQVDGRQACTALEG